MTLHSTQDQIQKRIQEVLKPAYLEVIDESDQHIGHAGHQGGGRHFKIVIASSCFKDQTRAAAHRIIYQVLQDLMKDQIHALRIQIVK